MSTIVIISMAFASAYGQIQRRPGSLAPVRTTQSVVSTKDQVTLKPDPKEESNAAVYKKTNSYIIAVEGDCVYTDVIPDENIQKGMTLYICEPAGYFVHPVSKAKIPRELCVTCELVVEEVFPSYLMTTVASEAGKSKIKPGLPIYLGEDNPRIVEIKSADMPTEPVLDPRKKYEDALMLMIEVDRENLPTIETNNVRVLSYVVKDKTITITNDVANDKVFNGMQKLLTKDNSEGLALINAFRNMTFHKMAKRAGYKTILRYQNKDNTKSFEVPVVTAY